MEVEIQCTVMQERYSLGRRWWCYESATLNGGADTMYGNAGDDTLWGDAEGVSSSATLNGGEEKT